MKKSGFFVSIIVVLIVAAMGIAFTSCGVGAPTIEKTYVLGELQENDGGHDSIVYQLNLLDDSTYELVKTTLVYGYSQNLGTYSVETFGSFTKGESTGGYTQYTLLEARRVIVNAYSDVGDFNIYVDTATANYPIELPTSDEKIIAHNSSDVISAYGKTKVIYVSDLSNEFSLTDPNA